MQTVRLRESEQLSGTLERGLAILMAIADGDGLSVVDLAAQQGVHRTTVVRLLKVLQAAGFVSRNGQGRWVLGTSLIEIGARALGQVSLRDQARPVMQRLSEKTRESIQLTIRSGDEMLAIDVIESSQAVRVGLPLGQRAPLYCTATGKAMLALLPADEVEDYWQRVQPSALTPHTRIDQATFMQELAEVRSRGYSVNLQESQPDVNFVGAAIVGLDSHPIAALVLGAPSNRLTEPDVPRYGALVKEAADSITRSLR